MKIILFITVFSISLLANFTSIAFLGYDNNKWRLFICKSNTCTTIKTLKEIDSFDYDFDSYKVVYKDLEGNVILKTIKDEKIILKDNTNSYMQPSFINDNKNIMFIELMNKNSKHTKIISTDLNGKNKQILLDQNSTILYPSLYGNDLSYTYVQNTDNIIKSNIFVKNLQTQEITQMTDSNTISHEPFITKNFIYYSFFSMASYHIYSISRETKNIVQLTNSVSLETNPIYTNGGIIFMKHTNGKSKIVFLKNSIQREFQLNNPITKIRNLKAKS